MAEREVVVVLEQEEDFAFRVRFDEGMDELLMDEPEPTGRGAGPNAVRVAAAAVGNCLTASLLFCLRKSRLSPGPLKTRVTAGIGRNEQGRVRLQELSVRIELEPGEADPRRLERCLGIFEDYCVVTETIRHGLPVAVEVVRPPGEVLYRQRGA